jgi:hypothetical protein
MQAMANIVEMQPRLGVRRLNSMVDIRDEMERVYKAMAKGKIEGTTGTKLIFALSSLLHATELATYQPMLEQAESNIRRRAE